MGQDLDGIAVGRFPQVRFMGVQVGLRSQNGNSSADTPLARAALVRPQSVAQAVTDLTARLNVPVARRVPGASQACAFVEPAGSRLVAASPFEPAGGVAGRFRPAEPGGEQSPDLADGERDEAGVGGRGVAWPGRRGGLGVSAFPEQRGNDDPRRAT
jgi:hypothetical protein